MQHEMIRTDAENGVWECPSCPRQIVLTRGMFRVLVQGDFETPHFGSTMPEIDLGEIQIEPRRS